MSNKLKDYSQTEKLMEQMSEENQNYFLQLMSYLVLATMFKDESAIREQIYNMAVDLREAEQDGLTAENFFGKDAQGMADAIIVNTPNMEWRSMAELIFLIGGGLTFYRLLQDFARGGSFSLNFPLYLLTFAVGNVAVYLILKCLSRMIYGRKVWWWSTLIGLLCILCCILLNASKTWFNLNVDFVIPLPWDIFFVFFVSMIYLFLIWRNPYFRCFIYPILSFLIVGVIKRFLLGVLLSNVWLHKGLPIGVILLGFILFYWETHRQLKNKP